MAERSDYIIMNMEEVWKRVRKPWSISRCRSEIHLERKRNSQKHQNRMEDKWQIFEAVNFRTRNCTYYPFCDIFRKTIIIGWFIYRCCCNPLYLGIFLEQSNSYRLLDRVSGVMVLRRPEFLNYSNMKAVTLLAYSPATFSHKNIYLLLISVRSWVHSKTIVLPEVLCQWQIPITPSEIEPTTFRVVVWEFLCRWEFLSVSSVIYKCCNIFINL
jgi:hypothetical protein